MSGTVVLLLIALGVVALFGLSLLIWGVRGRRINDHPVCRACGFDLKGLYPDAPMCPECGRDVRETRSVRSGVRTRRRWTIVAGAALLTIGVVGLGGAGYALGRSANLNPYKPTWLLAMEAQARNSATASAAISELVGRIEAERLSEERVASLIENALYAQSDLDAAWLVEWGNLIDVARVWGHVTDEQYRQYMRQALGWDGALSLVTRERLAQGDHLPVGMALRGARVGGSPGLWFSADLQRMTVGPTLLVMPQQGAASLGLGGGARGQITTTAPIIEAPAGKQPVETIWRLSIGPGPSGADPAGADSGSEALTVVWTETLAGEIEMLSAGTPTIDEVDDPSLREAIRSAIDLQQTRLRQAEDGLRPGGSIIFQQRPIAVAFDIYWRSGERTWKVGSVAAPAGGGWGMGYGHGAAPVSEEFGAGRVDVILRSSVEAARTDPTIQRIWKGEIVFEDIEVDRPAP